MVSVVIVTHNSESCIGACLDAVVLSLPDAERLVIDNASADASRAIAERRGATVVALGENLGFGRACNVGVQRATRRHILFLNPDVIVRILDADALARVLSTTPLGLLVPTSTRSSFIFTERSWIGEAVSLTLGALRPRELPRFLPWRRGSGAPWASGAALLASRSEFLGIGGFDSRYFLYYEDRDLSWRYRDSGLPVRATAALVADHVGGGSAALDDRRSNILAFAMMGWLQYLHAARGPDAARRAWMLAHCMHAAITRSVEGLVRIAPSARVRRKSLQLREVTQALDSIRASSGVLEQSDGCAYWPDAVALLRSTRPYRH